MTQYKTFKSFCESVTALPIYFLCEKCKESGIQESDEFDMETKTSRQEYITKGQDKIFLKKVCYECKSESGVDENYLKGIQYSG